MAEHDQPVESSSRVAPRPTFADLAADAVRYWERRRLLYNLALTAVVAIHVVSSWPASGNRLSRDLMLSLFLLAVIANILYCVAYGVDLFLQFSGVRQEWPRYRWILLLVGTCFAAVIAHFVSMAMFGV